MNTKQLFAIAALSFLGSQLFAGGGYDTTSAEESQTPDMLELYFETERAAARYHDEPPEPHWTDTLKEQRAAAQSVGLAYGQNFGSAGAIRPAAEETFVPVSVYYRAKF